jgi:PAS domain S-box-containing protein
MVENSSDTIARYDLDCQCIYQNPALERLPSVAALFGKPDDMSAFSASLAGFQEAIAQVRETGCESEYRLRWRGTDGQERWSQVRIAPEYDPRGDIVSVLTIGRDVTELLETERDLLNSQELLRKLLLFQQESNDNLQKKVSWEVYDTLGQLMMVQKMDIDLLRRERLFDAAAMTTHLAKMTANTDAAISLIRSISERLRPVSFNMGIPLALEWIVAKIHRDFDIKCELSLEREDIALGEQQANILFYVVWKTLQSVGDNYGAAHASVDLSVDNGYCALRIKYAGNIRESELFREGNLGFLHMQERVHALGGGMEFLNRETVTVLEIRLPIADGAPNA